MNGNVDLMKQILIQINGEITIHADVSGQNSCVSKRIFLPSF